MKKYKGIIKEIVFYVALLTYGIMKIFDVQFVSKMLGPYISFMFVVIIIVYVKHVNKMPDTKKKFIIQILMPILTIISLNMFMLIGVFILSFEVFKRYERTTFNKVMKGIYAFAVAICIIVVGYSGAYYMQAYEEYDRYNKYVVSPDGHHVVTLVEYGTINQDRGYEYRLERVYLGTFRKNERVLLDSYNIAQFNIIWLSNEIVEINGALYEIN